MESKKEDLNLNDKIPKERRIRTKDTKGEFDEDGFFTTPNGSFWDMDGEYFNRYGYDIHGGKYLDKLDYIPGPSWLEEFGCYPEDKDKYQKEDLNDIMDLDGEEDKDMDLMEGEGGIIDEINKLDMDLKRQQLYIIHRKSCLCSPWCSCSSPCNAWQPCLLPSALMF